VGRQEEERCVRARTRAMEAGAKPRG
jgi:hypothetical protein